MNPVQRPAFDHSYTCRMIVEVAVIGTGFMGRNHARVLSTLPGAHLAAIVDADADRARGLALEYGCSWGTDLDDVAKRVDAVVIAVPTHAHHEVAMRAFDAGLHVLVEKPIAETVEQARSLVDAAASTGLKLAVGHIERFNPACLDLKQYVNEPRFIQMRRLSPYTPRIHEGVIRDMMIHDIDLMLWLAGGSVDEVDARAIAPRSESEDLATVSITFDNGVLGQLTSARIAQRKVRTIDVIQDEELIHVDLLQQSINIFRQTKVEQVIDGTARFREASVSEIPYLSRRGEPLALELEDFIGAVADDRPPLVTGAQGLAALELSERLLAATAPAAMAT